jgi:hypothetical protein
MVYSWRKKDRCRIGMAKLFPNSESMDAISPPSRKEGPMSPQPLIVRRISRITLVNRRLIRGIGGVCLECVSIELVPSKISIWASRFSSLEMKVNIS